MGLLSRERTIAGPGFNRWLVPPAALAIHLSIGMAYGLSVFWKPLTQTIGITQPAPDDWKLSTVVVTFSIAIFFLGSSAAVFGRWLERVGPRQAGVAAACCWGGGFLIAAAGARSHQIWLIWLGLGVIGGCGLGLGYISPVSTLIKWFPDRRGLATGMAIMGFGGGAMIGAPLGDRLMRHFATPESVGVWQTFVVLGVVYFLAMMAGAFGYRVPAPGLEAGTAGRRSRRRGRWSPRTTSMWMWRGRRRSSGRSGACSASTSAPASACCAMASPLIQEMFGGRLIGIPGALAQLTPEQRLDVASVAAGFTGLLSLANIVGRLGWASLSDAIGRKRTYVIFFALGAIMYALVPTAGRLNLLPAFVAIFVVILTMYGGGFATIPAYLADIFGTQFVGAIHGRLLTAWSVAGLLGPWLVNTIREFQLARGVAPADAYNVTMYILAGLLVIGFFCNLAVRPVNPKYYLPDPGMPVGGNAPAKGAE